MSLQTKDGKSHIYSGKSRSGKTEKCRRDVRAAKFDTVFVFDIEAQWHKLQGYKKITDIEELMDYAIAGRKGHFAFVPKGNMRDLFEKFCQCVFFYGSHHGECACVAEELAEVTNTQKAPEHWGAIVRRGLKRSIHIYALSTRWSEADKSCLGNATTFSVFQAGTFADAKYIADKTRIPLDRIEKLKKLEYLVYDTDTFEITGSKLRFN